MSVNIYLIQETVDAILLLGAYTCFHFFLLPEIRGSFRYSNIRGKSDLIFKIFFNIVLVFVMQCERLIQYVYVFYLKNKQCLGDQSAALVGQMCFQDGQAKNT